MEKPSDPIFRSKLSETIFQTKYAHKDCETWSALAHTLAKEVVGPFQEKLGIDYRDVAEAIAQMKFIPGGRYLYYAGRPSRFFSNCYMLAALEDTREDWAHLSWKAEMCLMTGGGIGVDYSVYRPSGSRLGSTGGVASGPVPKMMMINDIGRRVMQGGSRRSAIYASLNWRHGDIHQFLTAKNWHEQPVGKTGKTLWDIKQEDWDFPAPLDGTNISVNYDTSWLLDFYKTGEVGDVFLKNVKQALTTGEPGFSFNFFDKEKETLRNACVPGDTRILTRDGYREIDSLVGKTVDVWNGEDWESVTPFSTGVNDTVVVHLSDGTSLRCTPYHKFVVCGSSEFRPAGELTPGDRLEKFGMPVVVDGKPYDVDGYSQGFYSGDGNSGYHWSCVYPTKHACMPRLKGSFSKPDKNGRVIWTHGPMFDKRFVPINGTLEYCLEWLAGLLDSDGTVTRDKNGSGFQIASIDKGFLLEVRLMLTRMGVRAKVVKLNPARKAMMPDGKGGSKEYCCMESWRLLIGNADAYALMQQGLRLCRLKHDGRPPQRDARRFVKVVRIEASTPCETFCFTAPKSHRGTFNGIVTGQCTELVSSDDSDVCNLASINLSRIESISEMVKITHLATMFLVCGTIVGMLPYQKVYEVREKNRRLGLGLMGMHEWLLRRGQRYEVTPELHQWLSVYKGASDEAARRSADLLSVSRPVGVRAIAPVGTIGMVAGTTTGIEPVYAVAYKRYYLTPKGRKFQYAIDHAAETLIRETGINPDSVETAVDLARDYERRMKFQADVQDYVDQAISSTINLPNPNTHAIDPVDFAKTLARYAPRLRGFTCYPDGSRGGQPLVSVAYEEAKTKLGKELEERMEINDVCDLRGGGVCGS